MMSLEAGDIVWVVFDTVVGSEQGGRRPAIVLTDGAYNALYPRSIVCPITQNMTPWPTKILLPDSLKTRGAILADQPRTLHREGRSFRLIEHAPADVLMAVRAVMAALLGISS